MLDLNFEGSETKGSVVDLWHNARVTGQMRSLEMAEDESVDCHCSEESSPSQYMQGFAHLSDATLATSRNLYCPVLGGNTWMELGQDKRLSVRAVSVVV